jgi:protein involved in polysaccharide export with SLBB domain
VQVLGRVRRPGILPYIANQTVKDYIERAGSYAVEADKGRVRIVRAVSGAVEKPHDDRPPLPGDQVIIPTKSKTSMGHKLRYLLTVVGATATTYLVFEKITE